METPQQPPLVPTPDNPSDIKSPVFTPRPGWGGQLGSFFKRIFGRKVYLIFILAIAGVILVNWFIRNKIQIEEPTATKTSPVSSLSSTNTVTVSQAASTGDTFQATAKKGQGVTHLARQVIAQYLKENNITLTPEQKVYAEDFLRRKATVKSPAVGQTVDFMSEDVANAVNRAKGLPLPALQNLTPYADRVREFN